jgi:hypothetical protein
MDGSEVGRAYLWLIQRERNMAHTQPTTPEATLETDALQWVRRLSTGHWFHALLVESVHDYNARAAYEPVVSTEPLPAAERIIKKASVQAALLGTGAAAITTGGAFWTSQTHGVAGLVAIPAAGAAMLADLLTRARVTVRMSCEIAGLFGIRFTPEDPADLAQLQAVASESVHQPDGGDARGHDLLESLVGQHQEQLASAVGSAAVAETLVRNVIPVIGLLNSGWTSYRMTQHIGQTLLQYSRARRALEDAIGPIEQAAPQLLDLLVEGIWFMFTSDGQLNSHESAILAHLIHRRPSAVKHALLQRLHDDEAGWLERLAEVPSEQRPAFLHVLTVASAADSTVADTERALLERAARALSVSAQDGQLEELARSLRERGLAA